jgi:putative transposase
MRSLAKEICSVSEQIGNKRAICKALGVTRATFYRACIPVSKKEPQTRWKPPRALSDLEKNVVADILNDDRFGDKAPTEVYATLLDESRYYCSPRTMYRILKERHEVRERGDVLSHPIYQKPELLATAPNQVWSWDITKMKGPAKWTYFYLYLIIDIYSKHVVGWLVAPRESAELAKHLISETFYKQRIDADGLVIHRSEDQR